MKKVLLFDYDDTLVQTFACKSEALVEMGKRAFSLSLTREDVRRYWGLPYQEFLQRLFGITPERMPELLVHYRALSPLYPLLPYDGVPSVLETLARSYRLGIITATSRYAIQSQMQELGINPILFSLIQTADDSIYHKPDPRVFAQAFQVFGEGPSEFVYVGDSLRDFEAAHGAGIDFVACVDRTATAVDFDGLDCLRIRELTELPGLLAYYFS